MEWKQGVGSTASSRVSRAPGDVDPKKAAQRGQAAELINADIKADYVGGVAPTREADPARRAADEQTVTAEITTAMRAAQVPPAAVVFKPLRSHGHFSVKHWTLFINSQRFHQPQTRIRLLATVYHEARHAEQYFDAIRTACRLMPEKNVAALAAWIKRKGEVVPPMAILQAAKRDPGQAGEGEQWFELYFKDGAKDYREAQFARKVAAIKLASLRQERERMRRRARDGYPPSRGTLEDFDARRKAALAEAAAAHKLYETLANEVDARRLGDDIQSQLHKTP